MEKRNTIWEHITRYMRYHLWPLGYKPIMNVSNMQSLIANYMYQECRVSNLVMKIVESGERNGLDYKCKWICDILWEVIYHL